MKNIKKLNPFGKFCCTIGNLPTSYMESLTYEEQLLWFCDFLERTVIPTVNNNAEAVEELQNFVAYYFDNLDVQEEINKKLDTMASNGQLSNLIQPLFNNYKNDIQSTILEQNTKIDNLEDIISSINNGSPLVASSISGMTDTSKIYVNTSDGNWYYYNGSNWVSGGTYQSLGISDNSITIKNLVSVLQNDFTEIYTKVDLSNIGSVAGKFIQTSNGTEGSYSLYSHTEDIPVTPKEKYYTTALGLADNTAIAAFYNANNIFISAVGGTTEQKGRPFTVPTGASKMKLTYTTSTGIELMKLTTIKVNGLNKFNYNDMDEVFKNTFTPVYGEVSLNWINGKFADRSGQISSYTGFQYVDMAVTPGEKLIITGSSESNQVLYQYRKNGQLVSYPSSGTSVVQHTNVELIIPEGVFILRISNNPNRPYSVKKVMHYETSDTENYDIEQLKMFNINEQLKNDFKWSRAINTAKYVTFTFDDSLADIDLVENLFESKGVPCCFATIPERLNNLTTNGETVKEVLNRCVAHGGEVLSHSASYLTSNSTDEQYKEIYINKKKKLEKEGFKVYGIITSGGDGALTQDFTKDTLIARNNYLYGDLTAYNDHSIEQYYNPRQDIYDLNYHKSQIDGYVAGTWSPNSKWLNYLMHGTSTFTIQALGELIDYCIAKGLTVATWNTVYNTFRSTKLEERIKDLEN